MESIVFDASAMNRGCRRRRLLGGGRKEALHAVRSAASLYSPHRLVVCLFVLFEIGGVRPASA
jgi:hypothetical protein